MTTLIEKKCIPCEGNVAKLAKEEVTRLLKELNHWRVNEAHTVIHKRYEFTNFYKTMAFVNAIAWLAHQENHHPTLELSYNYCEVKYYTHAINGLSENDFICAAKIDRLITAK